MVVFIFIGGGIGAAANYTITVILGKLGVESPMINWVINMMGCLLIGIFYALEKELQLISTNTFTVLTGGMLTGFTNYAMFSLGALQFLMRGDYLRLFLYTGSTVCFGMVFAFVGIFLFRVFRIHIG